MLMQALLGKMMSDPTARKLTPEEWAEVVFCSNTVPQEVSPSTLVMTVNYYYDLGVQWPHDAGGGAEKGGRAEDEA